MAEKTERNAELRRMAEANMSRADLCRHFGLTPKRVSKILTRDGRGEKLEAERAARNAAIVAAARAGNETMSAIGERFGVSGTRVAEILAAAGVPPPRGKKRYSPLYNRDETPWTDQEIAILRREWDAGTTTAAIAKSIGRNKNMVISKVHRLALPSRPSPIRRSEGLPERNAAIRAAYATGETKAALARRFALHQVTVCNLVGGSDRPAPPPAGFSTLPPLPSIAAIPRPAPLVASLPPSPVPPRATTPPAPLPAPRQLATPYVARPRPIAPARPAAPPMTPPAPARHIAAPAEVEVMDWRAKGWPEPGSPETLGGVVAAQGIAEHPLAGRDARCCQWPLGEPGRPGFRYCDDPQTTVRRLGPLGLPVFVASPYCEAHRAASVTRYVAPGRAVAGSAEGDRAAV